MREMDKNPEGTEPESNPVPLESPLSPEKRERAMEALLEYQKSLRDVPVQDLIEGHRFTLEEYARMSNSTKRAIERKMRREIGKTHLRRPRKYGGTRKSKALARAHSRRKKAKEKINPFLRWRRVKERAKQSGVEFLIDRFEFDAWVRANLYDKKGRNILTDYLRVRFKRKDNSKPYTIQNTMIQGVPRTCKHKKYFNLVDGALWDSEAYKRMNNLE